MRFYWCGVFGLAILLSQVDANPIAEQSTVLEVEGAVRLVGGEKTATTYSGRIEIYHAGEWGTVCDDGTNKEDAVITCRGLGYGDGELWDAPAGSGEIWMDSIDCEPEHNSLVECDQAGWGIHDCHHGEDTGVLCTDPVEVEPVGPTEGEVRLVGGEKTPTTWSGRVEIYHDGQWGTVCDDGVDDEDAKITCRGLGYDEGVLYDGVSPGEGPIWMDQINCNEEHNALVECDQDGWGLEDCSHSEDIGVVCSNPSSGAVDGTDTSSTAVEGEARLVGGEKTDDLWSGRVEIFHDGQWGTVCDDDVNEEDAEIVCQGLGYAQGAVMVSVPAGTGPIWMDQIDCDYPQTQLSECYHNAWGSHDCSHDEDFGVTCTEPVATVTTEEPEPTGPVEGEVRLVGSEQTDDSWSGRVEIFHAGEWGTVCDDGIDNEDRRIICRGLGYEGAEEYDDADAGSGQIWMDDINCDEEHANLAQCDHSGWGEHNCGHHEDVAVTCVGRTATEEPGNGAAAANEGDVRLSDGSITQTTWSGRLEIYHNGEWGTVCDDGFNYEDFNIICQGLGYARGSEYSSAGEGTGPIWMDAVNCDEGHSGLQECDHGGWGIHDCSHSEDVGVLCE